MDARCAAYHLQVAADGEQFLEAGQVGLRHHRAAALAGASAVKHVLGDEAVHRVAHGGEADAEFLGGFAQEDALPRRVAAGQEREAKLRVGLVPQRHALDLLQRFLRSRWTGLPARTTSHATKPG